jgi:hypothetical protein
MPNRAKLERLKATQNLNKYQTKMKARRDKKVKEKTVEVREPVLRSPRTEASGKLHSKWDGPYLVVTPRVTKN